jgi:hypothetical protein
MLLAFRRLTRFFALLGVLWWAFQARFTLAGLLGFARTAPTRLQMGRTKELGLATIVHWALLREPRLKGAKIRVGSIEGSTVVLCAPATETRSTLARQIVLGLPGVSDVLLEDPKARPAPASEEGAGRVAG